jgi:CBS domain-containing protein
MSAKGIGALLVTEGEQLVGIITERDVVRKFAVLAADTASVRDLMTERILYVDPDQTVNDCMVLMTERHVRHLPVLDGGRLVGIVSIRDVVADVIAEQSFMIEQLEHYITGGRPR